MGSVVSIVRLWYFQIQLLNNLAPGRGGGSNVWAIVRTVVRSHWAALNDVQNLFLLNAAQIVNQQENTAAYEGLRIKIVFTDIDRVSAAPNGHLT